MKNDELTDVQMDQGKCKLYRMYSAYTTMNYDFLKWIFPAHLDGNSKYFDNKMQRLNCNMNKDVLQRWLSLAVEFTKQTATFKHTQQSNKTPTCVQTASRKLFPRVMFKFF